MKNLHCILVNGKKLDELHERLLLVIAQLMIEQHLPHVCSMIDGLNLSISVSTEFKAGTSEFIKCGTLFTATLQFDDSEKSDVVFLTKQNKKWKEELTESVEKMPIPADTLGDENDFWKN